MNQKRAMFVRCGVVLGLLAYFGLFAMAVFVLVRGYPHVWQSQSARFPGFLSAESLLGTLALAAPAVLIAAVKVWRDPNKG